MGFDDYTVQPGDTFISIAMKFDMSVYYLLRINQLSEVSEIYPDMILKVKHKEVSGSAQKLSENVKISYPTPTIKKEPSLPTGISKSKTYQADENIFTTDVLYCTFEGEIKGQLTVFSNRLAFCPTLIDNIHCEIIQNKSKKLILAANAQTFICFWDIFNAIQYELPPLDEDQPPMHFIQFFLSKIGKEKSTAIRKNTPKWCVNFQIVPIRKNYTELRGKAMRIINTVTAYVHNLNKSEEESYQTHVPYYEINEDSEENHEFLVNEPQSNFNSENKDQTEPNLEKIEQTNKNGLMEEEKTQMKDLEINKETENLKIIEPKNKKLKSSEENETKKEPKQQIEEVKKEENRIKISEPKQKSKIEEEKASSAKIDDKKFPSTCIEETVKNVKPNENIKENIGIQHPKIETKNIIPEPQLIHLNSEPPKKEISLLEEEPIQKQISVDSFKDEEIPNSDHDEIYMPWSTPHKNSIDISLTSFSPEKNRLKHSPRKSCLDSSPKKVKSEASFEDIPIEDEPEEPLLIPLPDLSEPSTILSENMIKQILTNLPMMYQIRSWKLAYSPKLHGTSLSSFYRNLSKCGPSILVVLDQNMNTFGGLASDTWAPSHQFYGNGDCFLFTFHNTKKIKCFFPTLENEYFMASSFEGISMGSGGKSGLYIYGDLMKGSSGVSKTYNNEVLSKFEYFNILKLEVWALV